MQLISLDQVLKTMRKRDKMGNPLPFSIACCTYNRTTGEGGDRLEVEQAVVYVKKRGRKDNTGSVSRVVNHHENSTRNIQFIPSGEIRKIHIRLIEKFNGKTVYY